MQNIPGLSFFDGLTKSRGQSTTSQHGRAATTSGASPRDTPLLDAAQLRGAKSIESLSHPLGESSSNSNDSQDDSNDLLSDSHSANASPNPGNSMPATSFSRRAVTLSSASSPSPIRRLTNNSVSGSANSPPGAGSNSGSTVGPSSGGGGGGGTSSRPSILSKDGGLSLFGTPILGRRASSQSTSSTGAPDSSGRARSGSTASRESGHQSEEPTAKDVTLMAQGTVAYALLKRIQEHPIELADIIRLLVTKKAILILPTCAVPTESSSKTTEDSTSPPTTTSTSMPTPPTRAFFENHVIITESNQGESLFVTLSGIRGLLKPSTSSITLLGLATGQDTGTIASDASGPIKRAFFDNVAKTNPLPQFQSPSTSEATSPPASVATPVSTSPEKNAETPEEATPTVETDDQTMTAATVTEAVARNSVLKMVNSSRRSVMIFVEAVGSIHALLVDHSIEGPEGEEAPTPIVPLSQQNLSQPKEQRSFLSSIRRTANSSSSSVRSLNLTDVDGSLPKLPKIATDLPLEWESMVRDLDRARKNPFPNADRFAHDFQRKYDSVRQRFVALGVATGLKNRWSDQDYDDLQQWVEAWLCRELYNVIFSQPGSQDYMHDEQLQAKIAALNFLDLNLGHLGFVLEHPEDVKHIAQVVHQGGTEMQKLALVRSPSEKMNVILSSHRVVVDALNKELAVQEMLAEVEKSGDGSDYAPTSGMKSPSKTSADKNEKLSKSKRVSMPKIPMDGEIPRARDSSDETPLQSTLPAVVHSQRPKIPMDEGYDRPSSLELSRNDDTVLDDVADLTMEPVVEGHETEVDPVSIPLPLSPEVDRTLTSPVLTRGQEKKEKTSASEITSSTATGSKRQYSADVLLPLLIFSVVKSNPPMLISNLRYIQRFKVQDHLSGELAYCLTNMMAVVSFLETLDPKALGLTSDIQVMSDVSDIQQHRLDRLSSLNTGGQYTSFGSHPGHGNNPRLNFQEGFDQTKALGQKVSQEIVGVAEEGIKVISDVVQDGYSKFLGRFLSPSSSSPSPSSSPTGFFQPSAHYGSGSGSGPFSGRVLGGTTTGHGRGVKTASAAAALAAAAAADAAAVASLSESQAQAKDGQGPVSSMLVSPAVLTSDVNVVSVDGISSERPSVQISTTELVVKSQVLEFVRSAEGPKIHLMACVDPDDLRLCDVKGLLQDYQRIGKILEEMKKLA